MRPIFTIADSEYAAWLQRTAEGYRLHRDRVVPVALERAAETDVLTLDGVRHEAVVAVDGDVVHIHLDGSAWTVRYHDPVERHGHHHGASADDVAQAPMPGTVIAVHVTEGHAVARGDTLVVIESMKLETAIKAWRDGTIETVHVAAGQAFDRGAALVTLAAEA